jgi:DNA-binding protein YbaB
VDLGALARSLGPIQEAMRKAQAERETTVIEGRSGGGAVSIRITGALTVQGVKLAPGTAQGDAGMLEDLVSAALADALRQHRERYGASPDEQMARIFKALDPAAMMGMMGGFGR